MPFEGPLFGPVMPVEQFVAIALEAAATGQRDPQMFETRHAEATVREALTPASSP